MVGVRQPFPQPSINCDLILGSIYFVLAPHYVAWFRDLNEKQRTLLSCVSFHVFRPAML